METEDKEVKLSPTLAIALDVFGQVVAYRATTVADVRWLGARKGYEPPRDARHHGGRRIDEWMLQKEWRLACRLAHGVYPRSVTLAPATRALLAALEKEEDERKRQELIFAISRQQEQHEEWIDTRASCDLSRPLDYKAVPRQDIIHDALAGRANRASFAQSSFLTVMNLLSHGGRGGRAMSERFGSLIVWLHAVPWYTESEDEGGKQIIEPTSVEEWCDRQFARFGPDVLARETKRYSEDYRLWVRRAGREVQRSELAFLLFPRPTPPGGSDREDGQGRITCSHVRPTAPDGAICTICATRASEGVI